MITEDRLCERQGASESLKVSSIPTSKDGAREDPSRVQEACGEHGNTEGLSRTECRLCVSAKTKLRLQRAPRLAMIYSSF